MIFCLSCGARLDDKGSCPSCGVPEPGPVPERITSRYDRFQEAVARVRDGRWGPGDMQQFLEAMWTRLTGQATAIGAFIEETGYREFGLAEIQMGVAGMQEYELGMQAMYRYVEDGDPAHLDDGLALIWEGNERINVAMWMNREARRRFAEDSHEPEPPLRGRPHS